MVALEEGQRDKSLHPYRPRYHCLATAMLGYWTETQRATACTMEVVEVAVAEADRQVADAVWAAVE